MHFSVLRAVENSGFEVVLACADNHVVNRNFFTIDLCGGVLSPFVPHPLNTDRKLFLLFDPTHNIKNAYNNFHTKREFVCPSPSDTSKLIKPNFDHLEDLFTNESSNPLRLAHKLTHSTVFPSSIQKTSVKLSLSVFHESTCKALLHYAREEGCSEWEDTAEFIQLFIQLWKVVNVKSPTLGFHKREPLSDPIRSVNDEQLSFLMNFEQYLTTWQDNSLKGFSRETFIAFRQMCRVIPALSRYLLNDLGFQYVLTGKFQSDCIESRFGFYRQLSGANYYLSVKQVIDNEKKVRVMSLLKYSQFSTTDFQEFVSVSSDDIELSNDDWEFFQEFISVDSIEDLNDSDLNVLYYVSGYICRSVIRTLKLQCQNCLRMLCTSPDRIEMSFADECFQSDMFPFFEELNRGGLMKPSDRVFTICCIAYGILIAWDLTTFCILIFCPVKTTEVFSVPLFVKPFQKVKRMHIC